VQGVHKTPRIGKLDKLAHVRRELGRIYRKTARQEMDQDLARTLVFILRTLGETLVAEQLEQRLDGLEQDVKEAPGLGLRGLKQIQRAA
jgi:hypothetical protein